MQYPGSPIRYDSIQIADDASQPSAGEINPGIVANRNHILWLEMMQNRAFSSFSGRNFAPSDFRYAAQVPLTAVPAVGPVRMHGIGANTGYFFAALRDANIGVNSSFICATRDGAEWTRYSTLTLSQASGLQHSAVAVSEDGWVVLGCAHDTGNAGQRIDVVSPAHIVDQATRATLGSLTNWRAAVFTANRAYVFGGRSALDDSTGSNYARVASATKASGLTDWAHPTGGTLATALMGANSWAVATDGVRRVVAFATGGLFSSCLSVDELTNVVSEVPFPMHFVRGVAYWRGLFWCSVYEPDLGDPARIYSSVDGITWSYRSTVGDVSQSGLVVVGDSMMSFDADGDVKGAWVTFDGDVWSSGSVTMSATPGRSIVAKTGSRTAVLTRPGINHLIDPSALRISLGGLL